MKKYTKPFSDINISDISEVGGKNASLGEMFCNLKQHNINVPDGFASTAEAYWDFLDTNKLREPLQKTLDTLDMKTFSNLSTIGKQCRDLILNASLPDAMEEAIRNGLTSLTEKYGNDISLAARSSATAEDLPTASFAGQQETFLNVTGEKHLLLAFHHCYASLFTDRAIKYRADNGFEHMKVALSIGVQTMIRSDIACSGVMFTLDPDSGFENVVLISGAWGLGENVVQGAVNADEFLVFKPFLNKVKKPIISRKLGSKEKMMIYAPTNANIITSPEQAVLNIETPSDKREAFTLLDAELLLLTKWAMNIEQHYKRHMDIEWAKDGVSGELFIVQARPETVHSLKGSSSLFTEYSLKNKSKIICKGIGLGNRITSGKARILHSASEMHLLKEGEILVTERTDPD